MSTLEAVERENHTPGPWTAFYSDNAGQWYIDGADSVGGQFSIRRTAEGMTSAEMKANARLIASAPELLEALRDMVRYEDLPAADQQPAVERARAAISKATR